MGHLYQTSFTRSKKELSNRVIIIINKCQNKP